MKRFREQKLDLERDRKPFAPSTDAEDKADTSKSPMDSSLERKKAEERVAVMKASSSAELLIQNAKAAWHDIITTNASTLHGELSIVATPEAKDVAANGKVYNFGFPSKGSEGVTLPSFEYLKSQLEDMGSKFSVEAELAASSRPTSESDIGADEVPKKTSLSSMKAANKDLLKLVLDARQEMVSMNANFERREQSLLSVTQCLEEAIRVSHLAFERELADLRWKYRELRVRGGKRNTVLARGSSSRLNPATDTETTTTTTATSAPPTVFAAEEELREEILAEFKAEQERVVVELEGRVREQATALGTLRDELRNVSQSSQFRLKASEEEAARCRARADALQGEAEALRSDVAAVLEERDGLLQRERSRVAGDDCAADTASFDSLYVRMEEHRKLEQVLRETKHQHEALLRAWEEQHLELAKARVEAAEAAETRATQGQQDRSVIAPATALQASFIAELQASLEESKARISQLETTNRALRVDVQKLSSGYVVVYPLLQSMSTRGAHEWTSEEKEHVSDLLGTAVELAVQRQEFRLQEMRYQYEAELLSADLKKTRERLKFYTGALPLPGESEGGGGGPEGPSGDNNNSIAQFETKWDFFIKQL